jgi:hypothetical protein
MGLGLMVKEKASSSLAIIRQEAASQAKSDVLAQDRSAAVTLGLA